MKVTFQIEGANPVSIECNAGDNLLELARRANVAIDAPCSGNGSCGKCRVKLVEGEVETFKSRHITDEEYEAGWRLSCNCKVLTDCTVFVPDIASAYQSRMKTADLSSPKESMAKAVTGAREWLFLKIARPSCGQAALVLKIISAPWSSPWRSLPWMTPCPTMNALLGQSRRPWAWSR